MTSIYRLKPLIEFNLDSLLTSISPRSPLKDRIIIFPYGSCQHRSYRMLMEMLTWLQCADSRTEQTSCQVSKSDFKAAIMSSFADLKKAVLKSYCQISTNASRKCYCVVCIAILT